LDGLVATMAFSAFDGATAWPAAAVGLEGGVCWIALFIIICLR
jgi:hypothetical protein